MGCACVDSDGTIVVVVSVVVVVLLLLVAGVVVAVVYLRRRSASPTASEVASRAAQASHTNPVYDAKLNRGPSLRIDGTSAAADVC